LYGRNGKLITFELRSWCRNAENRRFFAFAESGTFIVALVLSNIPAVKCQDISENAVEANNMVNLVIKIASILAAVSFIVLVSSLLYAWKLYRKKKGELDIEVGVSPKRKESGKMEIDLTEHRKGGAPESPSTVTMPDAITNMNKTFLSNISSEEESMRRAPCVFSTDSDEKFNTYTLSPNSSQSAMLLSPNSNGSAVLSYSYSLEPGSIVTAQYH